MAIAKVTEIKADSTVSFEDAVKEGINRASKTLKHIRSAWVKDFEVKVGENGEIKKYRVLMRVTFVLEDKV